MDRRTRHRSRRALAVFAALVTVLFTVAGATAQSPAGGSATSRSAQSLSVHEEKSPSETKEHNCESRRGGRGQPPAHGAGARPGCVRTAPLVLCPLYARRVERPREDGSPPHGPIAPRTRSMVFRC
ncbi:hypothetical protein [Streptomyces sp. NPDC005438]|uniref:hypothetical protein n=1 Tax=Streptomyces sp. NPDC005438 TaxID=3156880 RepID=UPI0033ADF6CE